MQRYRNRKSDKDLHAILSQAARTLIAAKVCPLLLQVNTRYHTALLIVKTAAITESKRIMCRIRCVALLLVVGVAGCGTSRWESISTIPPEAETPEELFTEMIQAANSRNLKKFYGCLTNEARKDQIELMMHDLGRGGNVANDKSDQSTADISEMLASPQTALAVIDKYKLPRDREIKLDELPTENFNQFVLDMWQALQSKKKPYIDEDASMLELQDHGNWACAEVRTDRNRHGDAVSFIYFKKVNGQWRVDMGPWWYPWAEEHLSKEEKRRLGIK